MSLEQQFDTAELGDGATGTTQKTSEAVASTFGRLPVLDAQGVLPVRPELPISLKGEYLAEAFVGNLLQGKNVTATTSRGNMQLNDLQVCSRLVKGDRIVIVVKGKSNDIEIPMAIYYDTGEVVHTSSGADITFAESFSNNEKLDDYGFKSIGERSVLRRSSAEASAAHEYFSTLNSKQFMLDDIQVGEMKYIGNPQRRDEGDPETPGGYYGLFSYVGHTGKECKILLSYRSGTAYFPNHVNQSGATTVKIKNSE